MRRLVPRDFLRWRSTNSSDVLSWNNPIFTFVYVKCDSMIEVEATVLTSPVWGMSYQVFIRGWQQNWVVHRVVWPRRWNDLTPWICVSLEPNYKVNTNDDGTWSSCLIFWFRNATWSFQWGLVRVDYYEDWPCVNNSQKSVKRQGELVRYDTSSNSMIDSTIVPIGLR